MKEVFMDHCMRIFNGLICMALLVILSTQAPVFAKSASAPTDRSDRQRYIVILDDPPLAAYDGRVMSTPERDTGSTRLPATANSSTGARKLDVNSSGSKQYLKFLDERFKSFRGEALLRLGRQLKPVHRYRNALNGFATALSASEVRALRDMPGVSSVQLDEIQHLETDSGPIWIGAGKIHDESAGVPATGGEGIVIGIIDSGVNWDHLSFQDPGETGSGYDHENPYGFQLGLCSDPEVLCNDKLVGVYEFVVDKPDTEEIEEPNKGKDNAGHGSHVTSIAAGNPVSVPLNSGISVLVGGVAPNANIVSYRVCYIADPSDPDDDGCQTSAILSAIDQAISDKVDVLNYSIGTSAHDPWTSSSSTFAFLNARAAGIFVATSGGNAGPNAASIGSPANAPWITAVGNATHDRVLASILENLSGGDTAPPGDLVGVSLTQEGVGIRKIVHAIDYGNALCGTGASESGVFCSDNTGVSNPFAPGTFNGEIVVCDRGTYGRVEKGKNLSLAGAGGYILANTETSLQTLWQSDLCLPSTNLDIKDSDKLRTWLESGSGHQGAISGFSTFHIPEAGDSIAASSSRGPNLPPVADVMKPDVIAPGTQILGANSEENNFTFLTGTSMASPHVTGGGALIKAVHPDWTPSMIASTLMMTATPELALDFDGSTATPHKRGAGRPRLDQAVNAGLYLDVTEGDFIAADPSQGGDPKNLNLPGLVDTVCFESCTFQRTVTDLVGGASWSASVEGFADGGSVSITPNNFTLEKGASRLLTIEVNLPQPSLVGAEVKVTDVVGTWVYADVRLTSAGLPDAVFPLAVFADGGELRTEWQINSDEISGWQEFALDELAAMPDATFTSGGLVIPTPTVKMLPQDPTEDNPYDGSEGLMTVWHTVPPDALWLHSRTLESTAFDLDLFVGLDANDDGIAQASEELCASTSPTEIELCDLFTPVEGNYWIIVQNWTANLDPDEVTLVSAVVGKNTNSPLAATGDGIVPAGEAQKIRLSWDNVNAVPGTELIGAVGIGTRRESPNNIGIVPVSFTKTGVADAETLVLMNGFSRGLTLNAGGTHDRSFIDVPPGTDSLTIAVSGADSAQSENLSIELYRTDFDDAFAEAPHATAANTSGNPLASASGANGNGPSLTVNGGDLAPGRWYVVLKNNSGSASAVEVKADLGFVGSPAPIWFGLWEPSSRANTHSGIDFNSTGGYRAMLWYTYDEDGSPVWYQASSVAPDGNVFAARMYRYTNDGTLQHPIPVGHVSITTLGENDSIFSFVLFGQDGSDRMGALVSPSCPTVDGSKKSYDGLWSTPEIGLGGASGFANATSQAFVHYIYDDSGSPVWLTTAAFDGATEMSFLQWTGYCVVCNGTEPSYETVGVFERTFADESNLTWTVDYQLASPISGSINRTDVTEKLTIDKVCE
jgi:subtilisin family serine protease